jgi:hypothetical protein
MRLMTLFLKKKEMKVRERERKRTTEFRKVKKRCVHLSGIMAGSPGVVGT